MKKEYINPEMVVVKFAAPVVLQSNSPGNGEGFGSGSMNPINADSSQFYDNGDSNESW